MVGKSSLLDMIEALPEPDGTWGPKVTTETMLNGVPFAPYSKSDKLGRMADWTSDSKDGRDGRGGRQQYNRNYRDQQVYGAGSVSIFAPPVAEDESTFSVVSNVRDSTKTRFGRGAVFTRGRGQRGGRGDARGTGRQQFQRTGGRGGGQYGGGGGYDGGRGGRGGQGQRGRRFGWKDYDKPARNRDASINIKADWKLLEEIDYNRLSKLNLETDEGEDIDSYGFLYYYDRSYDKQPVKTAERKLTVLDRAAYNVTTSSDPVIQELAEKDEATIFATDNILSMLMCSTRSVYSWDIVIVRQGNKIFLDKRDNAALDMVTVNENAADAPLEASEGSKDNINQPGALAEEATYINHNFANQVVLESSTQKVEMAHENPFYNASEETAPPASKAYKYRRFDLSTSEEDPVHLVVRTEIDAVQKNAISGEDQFVTVHALNEFDSKAQGSGGALDWRTKLVSQRGAVVATEMKNNSCKLARWTVQSILAKADVMKLGFVSRANPKSNDKHVVLGVVGWKPRDFANQMNLQLSNGWGIVRTIADMCLKREDGKFILVKDPNKNILRLYELPAGSLDDDVDEAPETKPKSNVRPNGSILSYFKRVDEDLFIADGGPAAVEEADEKKVEEEEDDEDDEDADIYTADDLFGLSPIKKRGLNKDENKENERFNEDGTPVKRRKLSGGEAEMNSSQRTTNTRATTETPSRTKGKQQPLKKKRGPFIDDSDDNDEEKDSEDKGGDEDDDDNKPGAEEVKNGGTARAPEKQLTFSRRDELTLREVAPLLRTETSGNELGPDNIDEEHGMEGDDYMDDSFAGEELRERRYMQEQARLEAEEEGYEYDEVGAEDTSLMEACCPICNGSLAGVNETEATAHVNACLDGNPTSLPPSSPSATKAPSPKGEDSVDSPEMAKRFAKAAIPRPGQAIPFKLGNGETPSGDSEPGGGAGSSAFTKLLSGHAEDAAWATAAAAEHSARGMPAYKRTCPFYKIMPNNFSICVDAFRYGAVKDCNAYFLSHFHSDHYMGLTARWTHGPIYCSKVTGSLVKTQLKTAAKYVVELEFDEKVPVPNTNGVYVTMIPANHCPGSSLFLFEKVLSGGRTQRILHCGDFRACPEHIAHPSLRPNLFDAVEGRIKQQKIDVCYLDTTYLNPRYSFPPQEDVIRSCAELCVALNNGIVSGDDSKWNSLIGKRGAPTGVDSVSKFFKTDDKEKSEINGKDAKEEDETDAVVEAPPPNAFTAIQKKATNPNRLLVVCGTYSIGKERICKAIAIALKTKIFASPAKIKICKQLNDPELTSLLTSDPHEAQVHMQMIMEIRAETLAEYLESYRGHFSRIVGFRPSGWNYSPAAAGTPVKNITANLPPGSVPTTHLLHGPSWRTRFSTKDLTPQRGSRKEAMCFGVPYSEHSSFRELAMFLMSLRIERVVPTVNVGSEQSRKRMKGWTDRWLTERRRGGIVDVLTEDDEDDGKDEKEIVLWEGKDGKGGGAFW
ncbi:hypothetical protein V8F06_002972 [Rhypophila decipiens]